jgi:hypothetical protein
MNKSAIIISPRIPVLGIVPVILGGVSRIKRKEKKVEKIVSLMREDNMMSYTKRLSYYGQTGRSFRRFLLNM